jgi:hypothetical protein
MRFDPKPGVCGLARKALFFAGFLEGNRAPPADRFSRDNDKQIARPVQTQAIGAPGPCGHQ